MSEEFSKQSLAKSEKVIGQLYPRLVNQEGKSLDGDHRFATNPKWETKVIQTKNRSQEILVSMHAHHRRRVPQQETKAMIVELAKELEQSGIPKEDIATELVKIAPYTKRYILMLLPTEFKKPIRVEAGKVAGEIFHQKTMLSGLVGCDRCLVATREATQYKGETLCPSCLEKAKYKPEKAKPQPTPKVDVTEYKPKETWPQRKAVMTPQVSKMEQAVLLRLAEKGLHPETQKQFCLRSTRPDYYFPKLNLAIYLDGPVHKGREDRDEAIRELLQRRYGVKPVGIAYEGTSQAAIDEIVNRIVEAAK